jgi:hypothetical protein
VKPDFRRLVALETLLVGLVIAGCKHEPAPPTESDAAGVWRSMERSVHNRLPMELISLSKTNGQMQEAKGVTVYTFYCTATERHLSPVNTHPVGWIETYQGNYPFQWTEKGWLGPDGQVYPEH